MEYYRRFSMIRKEKCVTIEVQTDFSERGINMGEKTYRKEVKKPKKTDTKASANKTMNQISAQPELIKKEKKQK